MQEADKFFCLLLFLKEKGMKMGELVEIYYEEINQTKEYEETIQKVLETCFKEEGLEQTKLYIEVILTNLTNIQKFNREYRQIDKPTDVLSFPMFEKEEIERLKKNKNSARDALGSIAIAIPKVEEQAKEYGHSFQRELAYLLVHGFYHLMGYDHIQEEDKLQMRPKEENILNQLKITR